MSNLGTVKVRVIASEPISVSASVGEAVTVKMVDSRITAGTGEVYDGPVSVTPSASAQVLSTEGKALRDNITINPIPSNYGLITFDGGVLTVS